MTNNKIIWSTMENRPNVITQEKIIVTNEKKFDEIIKELRNIDKYVFVGESLLPGPAADHIEYTPSGAINYKDHGRTAEYSRSHYRYNYTNPRAQVYQLITGKFEGTQDLLTLFSTLECKDDKEKQLEQLKQAKKIINQLECSTLNHETKKSIIKQMWPNFGYYATECLDCTDTQLLKSYNIEELALITKYLNKNNIEISQEIQTALSLQELAQRNSKILSLAREAHKISNNNR